LTAKYYAPSLQEDKLAAVMHQAGSSDAEVRHRLSTLLAKSRQYSALGVKERATLLHEVNAVAESLLARSPKGASGDTCQAAAVVEPSVTVPRGKGKQLVPIVFDLETSGK